MRNTIDNIQANWVDRRVDILANAIAAGVSTGSGRKRIKLTLSLRPLKPAGVGAASLALWPSEIETLLAEQPTLEICRANVPVDGSAATPASSGPHWDLPLTRWQPGLLEASREANQIWSMTMPDKPQFEDPWACFYNGLDDIDDLCPETGGTGEEEAVICLSGGEGDIVLLIKMARAIETAMLAGAVADPQVAINAIAEAGRTAADVVVLGEPNSAIADLYTGLDLQADLEMLAAKYESDAAIPKNERIGRLRVAERKRELAETALGEVVERCSRWQEHGRKLCGSLDTAGEAATCAPEDTISAVRMIGGDLAEIYECLLRLRARQLLAAQMGDEEHEALVKSIESKSDIPDMPDAYIEPGSTDPLTGEQTDITDREFTERRLFGLEQTPDLGRLMRTFVDFEVPNEALLSLFSDLDEAEIFVFLRLKPTELSKDTDLDRLSRWSLAKLTRDGAGQIIHFFPALREELAAVLSGVENQASLEQRNAIVLLGRTTQNGLPTHELISADLRAAAQELESWSDRLLSTVFDKLKAVEASSDNYLETFKTEDLTIWNLRSGGLSVVNFGTSQSFSKRIGVARELGCMAPGEAYLDADDLSIGRIPYLGYAALREDNRCEVTWRAMVRKTVEYEVDAGSQVNIDAMIASFYDEGERASAQMTIDRAVARAGLRKHDDKVKTLAAVPEEERVSLGDPMGVETGLEDREVFIDPENDFNLSRKITLPSRRTNTNTPDAHLMPAIRFGAPSLTAEAVSFLGGATIDPEQVSAAFAAEPQATLPAMKSEEHPIAGRRFLRSEGVTAPAVAMPLSEAQSVAVSYQGGRRPEFTPQTTANVTLRTRNEDNQDIVIGPRTITRIILPPILNLEAIEHHGLFDVAPPAWYGSTPPRIVSVGRIPKWRTRYHQTASIQRPRDGMGKLFFQAPWGGLPLLNRTQTSIADRNVTTGASVDFGATWLSAARKWSEDLTTSKDQNDRAPMPSVPPGDPVFAANNAARTRLGRTIPFYPDPMAKELVLRFRAETVGPLETGGVVHVVPFVESEKWPDVWPIALKITGGSAEQETPEFELSTLTETIEGQTCRIINLTLPQGMAGEVDMWARPDCKQLSQWSELVDTMATLSEAGQCPELEVPQELETDPLWEGCGLLGRKAPDRATRIAIATQLCERLLQGPLPQVTQVRSLSVAHAVTKPIRQVMPVELALPDSDAELPVYMLARRVRDSDEPGQIALDALPKLDDLIQDRPADGTAPIIPSGWYLSEGTRHFNIQVGGTQADLGGFLDVDFASTGAIEIFARAIGVEGGGFDDPSLARPPELVISGSYDIGGTVSELGREVSDVRAVDEKAGLQKAIDKSVYGFAVSDAGNVQYPRQTALWARISNLPSATEKGHRRGLLSLHAIFNPTTPDTKLGDIQVETHPLFADTRSRLIEVRIRTVSRYVNDFAPPPFISGGSLGQDPGLSVEESTLTGAFYSGISLPASSRPTTPKPIKAATVSAERITPQPAQAAVRSDRISRVRLWLDRPWHSSGRQERLGLVIWPPISGRRRGKSLFPDPHGFLRPSVTDLSGSNDPKDYVWVKDFEDRYLAGAAPYVTRWGSDLTESYPTNGWSPMTPSDLERPLPLGPNSSWLVSAAIFPDFKLDVPAGALTTEVSGAAYIPNVALPVPEPEEREEGAIRPRQRYLNVDLLTYTPRFDIDSENWYVDVTLDAGDMVNPFLQIGVVRYNPDAPSDLQASLPSQPFHCQIPTRRTSAISVSRADDPDWALVTVRVNGPATPEATGLKENETSDQHVATRMMMRLAGAMADEGHVRLRAEWQAKPKLVKRRSRSNQTEWTGTFRVRRRAVIDQNFDLKLTVEEQRYRPENAPTGPIEDINRLSGEIPAYLCQLTVPKLD